MTRSGNRMIARDRVIGEAGPVPVILGEPERMRKRAEGSLHLSLLRGDFKALVRRALRIAVTALREIFDENAYERFLLRTGATPGVSSYREFQRERETTLARKPRCC